MKRALPYVAFSVALILIRLIFLLFSEYVYDEEEYKTGSIAALVMDGPTLPILEYQPGDYEGGTLFFGLATIPFFYVFGKTFVGLKALALATTLLLGLFSVLWARKMAGNAAALFAGGLSLFPIPYIIQVTSLPWGNYAETAALSALTFLIFHSFLFEKKQSYGVSVVLGFLWGFGTWVHYGYLVTPLTCLLIWHMTDAALFKSKKFYAAIASAIVGFSPWLAYNLTHHFWGMFRFSDATYAEAGRSRISLLIERAWSLLTSDLAAGMHFRFGSGAFDKIISYAYEIILVATCAVFALLVARKLLGWVISLSPLPRHKAEADQDMAQAIPLIYASAFGAAYCLSGYGLFAQTWTGFDPETHAHIFQLYPALTMVAAVVFGRLWPQRKFLVAGAFTALIIMGFLGGHAMVDFQRPQSARLHAQAWDKDVIFMEIGSKWARSHTELNVLVEKVPDHAKRSMSFGAGITYGLFHIGSLHVAVDKCAALPERWWPYCRLGIGTGLSSSGQLTSEELTGEISTAQSDAQSAITTGTAIGYIWYGKMDHPAIAQAAQAPLPGVLIDAEQAAWTQFLKGHLAMAQSRPQKE
jgi:hypothetical protein